MMYFNCMLYFEHSFILKNTHGQKSIKTNLVYFYNIIFQIYLESYSWLLKTWINFQIKMHLNF